MEKIESYALVFVCDSGKVKTLCLDDLESCRIMNILAGGSSDDIGADNLFELRSMISDLINNNSGKVYLLEANGNITTIVKNISIDDIIEYGTLVLEF